MSDDGCISTVDALNAVDSLESRVLKQDAIKMILSDWLDCEHWLKGVLPTPEPASASDQQVG